MYRKPIPLHKIYSYYLYLMDRTELKDGVLYWTNEAHQNVRGKPVGSLSRNGYKMVTVHPKGLPSKTLSLHRFMWWLENGPIPDHLEIDHKDGDCLNNLIDNLRLATSKENQSNRSGRTANKNVHFNKKMNKWNVRIGKAGVMHDYGYFDDLEFAELVASEAREMLHGEFARG